MYAANLCFLPLLLIKISCTVSGQISNDIVSIEDDIVKPPNDHRQYRALTLANGMKVLLISDNETSTDSMVLHVNVGYMNCPKKMPYLADLLARTLLIASRPRIKQKSGRMHAYFESSDSRARSTTNADHTIFDFDRIYAPLADVLKRFSNQLVSPQISVDQLELGILEFNHIEHFSHLINPSRFRMFLRSMANPNHDYYSPNLILEGPKNLSDENINKLALLKDMLQFYHRHYSANLISLVVEAKQNVNEMMQTVVPLFSRVTNKHLPAPVWISHPYGSEQTGYIFYIDERIEYKNILVILFNIPVYASNYFMSNPWSYVIHALTREGEKSLPVVLKENGLVNKVTASIEKVAEGFGFFKILCRLTQKGVKNVKQILQLVMAYLNYLKSVQPQEWIHRELQRESALKFVEMLPNSIYIKEVVARLRNVPAKYCIDERYALRIFHPQAIKNILSYLSGDNMNAYVWTKTVIGKPGKIGKFFDKKYTMEKMTHSFLNKLRSQNDSVNFTLPSPNLYLPAQLSNNPTIKTRIPIANISIPRVIWESKAHRIWHSKDTKFNSPEVIIGFKLMNSVKHASLSNYASSILYFDLVQHIKSTKFKQEKNARMRITFSSLYMGNAVYFKGRSDNNIYQFVLKAMETFTSLTTFNKKMFAQFKAKRNKWMKILRYQRPMMNFLKSPLKWTKAEIERGLKEVTYDQFNRFQKEFFYRLYIEMFAYGNITAQDTAKLYIDVLNIVKKHFRTRPLPLKEIKRPKMVLLPESKRYTFHTQAKPDESAIHILYQSDPEESVERMKIRKATFCVIEDIYEKDRKKSESFSDEEGNDELIPSMDHYGTIVDFSVGGISNTNKQFDKVVEDYIKVLKNKLMEMNETEMEKIKNHCGTLQVDSMEKVAYYYWSQIMNGEYTFNKTELAYQGVSKNDIINYYKEILSADSPKRQKIIIYICGASSNECNKIYEDRNVTIITDIKAFRNSLRSYPTSDESIERGVPPGIDSMEFGKVDVVEIS